VTRAIDIIEVGRRAAEALEDSTPQIVEVDHVLSRNDGSWPIRDYYYSLQAAHVLAPLSIPGAVERHYYPTGWVPKPRRSRSA
jgi:hypothetical protein